MKYRIFQKTFILIFALLALIFIIVGFSVDKKGYTSNILAEIAGLFISVVVAILLVERFTEGQRKKRWERVRKLTHRSISHHLSNILLELFNHFPMPDHSPITAILDSRDQPNSNTIDAINNIIEQMKNSLQQGKVIAESSVEYFNAIKWDISQIRHDLMPRVIQSSEDQNLIDGLVELNDTIQDLQSTIIMRKRQNIFPNIIPVLEKIRDVYKYL